MAVAFLTGFSFPPMLLNRYRGVSSMNKPLLGLVASVASSPAPRAFSPVSIFSPSSLCRAIISESESEEEKSDHEYEEDKKNLMELSEKFMDYIKEHIPSSAERLSHYQTKREWNGYAHYAMKKLSEEMEMIYVDGKEWVNGNEQTQFWFELSSNRIGEIVVAEKSILCFMEGTDEPIQETKLWDLISQRDEKEEEKKSKENQVDAEEEEEKSDHGGEVKTANGEGKEKN